MSRGAARAADLREKIEGLERAYYRASWAKRRAILRKLSACRAELRGLAWRAGLGRRAVAAGLAAGLLLGLVLGAGHAPQ